MGSGAWDHPTSGARQAGLREPETEMGIGTKRSRPMDLGSTPGRPWGKPTGAQGGTEL